MDYSKHSDNNIIQFLGTGTSSGVPQIGCACKVCTSTDTRDQRLRSSALFTLSQCNILIDAGPDLRTQLLRAGTPAIDALLVTHSHYDHLGGLDELRPYCYPTPLDIYCQADVADDIINRMPYCFGPNAYPGAPRFNIHTIRPYSTFMLKGHKITPLPIQHTPTLQILGYKIDDSVYITDCKTPPPTQVLDLLHDIDILVINALQLTEHPSHMNLSDALNVIQSIQPRRAFLTHMSHKMGLHQKVNESLPPNVYLAYDGLII